VCGIDYYVSSECETLILRSDSLQLRKTEYQELARLVAQREAWNAEFKASTKKHLAAVPKAIVAAQQLTAKPHRQPDLLHTSGTTAEGQVARGNSWPPKLQGYVERACALCVTDERRKVVWAHLEFLIKEASASGTLWITDWDSQVMPDFRALMGVVTGTAADAMQPRTSPQTKAAPAPIKSPAVATWYCSECERDLQSSVKVNEHQLTKKHLAAVAKAAKGATQSTPESHRQPEPEANVKAPQRRQAASPTAVVTPIRISVEFSGGRGKTSTSIVIKRPDICTLGRLKVSLCAQTGVTVAEQRLLLLQDDGLGASALQDNARPLAAFGIQDGSGLTLQQAHTIAEKQPAVSVSVSSSGRTMISSMDVQAVPWRPPVTPSAAASLQLGSGSGLGHSSISAHAIETTDASDCLWRDELRCLLQGI
jgi:hypothetical protein